MRESEGVVFIISLHLNTVVTINTLMSQHIFKISYLDYMKHVNEDTKHNILDEVFSFEDKTKNDIYFADDRRFKIYSGFTKLYHALVHAILADNTLTARELKVLLLYIRVGYGCQVRDEYGVKKHARSVYFCPKEVSKILNYRTNDVSKVFQSLFEKGWFDFEYYKETGRTKLHPQIVDSVIDEKTHAGWDETFNIELRNVISRNLGFNLVPVVYSKDPFKLLK